MTLPEDEEYESTFSLGESSQNRNQFPKITGLGQMDLRAIQMSPFLRNSTRIFTTEPVSVIGLIAFSFFVVPGAVIFGGVGVWLLFFSIMNPYHEDGGLEGFVCMGIPLTLVGLFCFLLWWAGVIKERLRVQHSRDRLVYQATLLGLGFPPLRGLGLLSEKRRLSEAVSSRDRQRWGRCNDPRPLERGGGVGARYRFCG
ncbi:MAG: hypothetical protein Ct9H90mP16_15450 [Candidatus Poseidoniales archaeon]|nr:MAG: hypothetical protein Ct9H90mP16_15450 [Candidatus Poseidoniales archaeon]